MTYYVDTNIFIRYLTEDVPQQTDLVEKRFEQAKQNQINLIVTEFTIAEVLYVLQSFYKMDKNQAVVKIQTIISTSWIDIKRKEAVLEALLLYKTMNIDFVDLLNWAVAKKNKAKILSFDKDFDKLTPKLRVEP